MEPILLIHGYGSEAGTTTARASVASIYGDLPNWLRREYGGRSVFHLDLARYISLEDGIGIDDISRAMDRALTTDFRHLLDRTFHVVIHSTGALVVRNWIRLCAPTRQPIRNLVYLAGANFGSGWAHVGSNRLARWGREVFTGAEAGVRVLEALELGSSATLDLHLRFLESGQTMLDHGVRESVIIGSQASPRWFEFPIRYAKEDGSDGVVRVSGANLNFSHARYEATAAGHKVTTQQVLRARSGRRLPPSADDYYTRVEASIPGVGNREAIPFAIPYNTAHSGKEYGIVSGSRNRDQVHELIKQALEVRNVTQWRDLRQTFELATTETMDQARTASLGGLFGNLKGWTRQAQYDAHSQVIVRLFDQDDRPVTDYDIYFGRPQDASDRRDIAELIVDTHRNHASKNVITFFLRMTRWNRNDDWDDELDDVDGVVLEIQGNEPQTDDIQYLPFRLQLDKGALRKWIIPHTTTLVDIQMLRIPSSDVFRMVTH